MADVSIRLLGPVEATVGGRAADIGRPRQRAVLAILAAEAGRPVTVDELVDRVWDEAPDRARHNLYVYIARLRHAVPVSRRTRAYQLDVDPDAVDLHRFRRLAVADPGAALREWPGGAPLAGIEGEWAAAQRGRWRDERRDAVVAWVDGELAAGRAATVVAPLAELVAEHPRAEAAVERLMLALRELGRYGEALDAYAALRTALAEALGADPGPSLQALHRSLLRGEPASGPKAPAQLPLDVRGFAGRTELLGRLDAIAAGTRRSSAAVVISALSGTAGVGKTALAVHWAHRAAGRFPDGQLYVNLRGFSPGGVAAPTEALRVFLDGLGVPPERVPPGPEAQAALFRSTIAGRRMLVVVDNARDADQVRPLLPGAPGCLVLVTSRDRLAGLVAGEGAVPLPLDLLDRTEARELLAGRLGARRVAAEPGAVEEIIDRCARLPLALAVAAARAALEPDRPLADVARDLAGAAEPLAPFAGADRHTDVRAVFSWSYRALRPAAARLFRLLGLHPGDDVAAPAAASVAGVPVAEAASLLAELAAANLLTEARRGRFARHDLLRAFTAELAAADPEAAAARRRIADHYLHSAAAMADRIDRFRLAVPLPPVADGVSPETPPDESVPAAVAWFAAEYRALLALVRATAASGDPALARHPARLARMMTEYQQRTGRWQDHLAVCEAARDAADRHGDDLGGAMARHGMARAYAFLGDPDAAAGAGLRAAEQYRAAGRPTAEADAVRSVSVAFSNAGRLDEALVHTTRLVALYQAAGSPTDLAQGLNTHGFTLVQLGRAAEALPALERALRLQSAAGDDHGAAFTLDSIGAALLGLGRLAEARDSYERARTQFAGASDRYGEVYPLSGLGDVAAASGDHAAARAYWERALRIARDSDGRTMAAALEQRLRG